ncbi:DUF2513 domain-containing protein [Paraburkholderia ferrariae]|jgi:hypothetical protein|uniref:DUF2513 domain-containing protein n=1 Tax=Paraburkholderia ferrariae TaxID=386056 RepID=UPI000480C667|nr:DUF2513 domain-containing protein [Paraburkholderia ferrariae]
MKRDMDLIRELMLELEALSVPSTDIILIAPDAIAVEGYDTQQIDYHLQLLAQAGLVDAGGADGCGMRAGPGIAFRSLSWAGHDFLDAVREQDVWEKTKAAAAKVGGYTVDILIAAAKAYVQQKITEFVHGPH